METTNILLRLPKELKADLEKIARSRGISTTGLIRWILSEYVDETFCR